MIHRGIAWLAVPALLTACGDGSGADSEEGPFVPVADVQQVMSTILEPAAEQYWDAVGWIIDTTGTTYIRPQTLEEWEAVRNAAFVIAESGNLLMMESRAVDEGPWMGMSQAMTDVARRAIEVAEARDEQGVFDVGAEIYQTCTNCHARYAVQTLRPNALPPDEAPISVPPPEGSPQDGPPSPEPSVTDP